MEWWLVAALAVVVIVLLVRRSGATAAPAIVAAPAAEAARPEPGGPAVELSYADARGVVTVRRVSVRRLEHYQGQLYFSGHCHLRGETRMFRCDRVIELVDTGTGQLFASPLDWARSLGFELPVAAADFSRLGVENRQSTTLGRAWRKIEPSLSVLIYAARLDGTVSTTERQVIDDLVTQRFTKGTTLRPSIDDRRAMIERGLQLEPSDADFERALEALPSTLSDRQANRLLAGLETLVACDGVTPAETALLGRVRAALATAPMVLPD